jgi:riboflavin synthase
MFTGLIESVGVVTRLERAGSGGLTVEIYAPDFGRDMAIGDSIAVDGACLTVTSFIRGAFVADISEETARRSTLGALRQGANVNMERAMRLSDRVAGHLVTGHVDGVGTMVRRQAAGNSTIYTFTAPAEVAPYIAEKGSIAIDGISLTVSKVVPEGFQVAVIPHTEQSTTLKDKTVNAPANMEADVLAKYTRRFVAFYTGNGPSAEPGRRGLGDMLKEFGG